MAYIDGSDEVLLIIGTHGLVNVVNSVGIDSKSQLQFTYSKENM